MRAIEDHDELVALCGGDTLCLWAAQGLDGSRGRAWANDGGLAVAGTSISRRDRIAVRGRADAVVPLVGRVLAEVGPTYRPLGDPDLVHAIVGGVPGLVTSKTFGWMETSAGPPPVDGRARWLSEEESPEAAALLQVAHPNSEAGPGLPDDGRWAGIRDGSGRLVALAALAWCAPAVGLVAGVAVHPDARGLGLGREVCGFVVREALARHGNAALMVDEWNETAVRLYRRLGMRYRPVLAAAPAGTSLPPTPA
jgi:GNAT superfamily N-acetyltransferase